MSEATPPIKYLTREELAELRSRYSVGQWMDLQVAARPYMDVGPPGEGGPAALVDGYIIKRKQWQEVAP
jgi:hypothetical protein